MVKVIRVLLISNDEKNYAVTKRVISQLDFLYEGQLELVRYAKISSSLKEEICNLSCPKIYILNVKEINQVKLAKLASFIRKNDWHSEIILVKDNDFILSQNWNNIPKLFDVITDRGEELGKDIKLICNHIGSGKTFNFQNKKVNLNIYLENILYIYRDTKTRKIVVITDNNVFNLNMDLKDALLLLDNRFRQVHKSCILNVTRTEKYDWTNSSFILDNGNEVNMLSKHYKNNIDDLF